MFNYKGSSDDLYFVEKSIEGEFLKPNRNAIRNFVDQEIEFYKEIVSSGGNKRQAELDVADASVELLTHIVVKDRSLAKAISDIFTEERVAQSNHAMDVTEADLNLQQTNDKGNGPFLSGKVILTIVTVIAVLFITVVVVMGR